MSLELVHNAPPAEARPSFVDALRRGHNATRDGEKVRAQVAHLLRELGAAISHVFGARCYVEANTPHQTHAFGAASARSDLLNVIAKFGGVGAHITTISVSDGGWPVTLVGDSTVRCESLETLAFHLEAVLERPDVYARLARAFHNQHNWRRGAA